MDVSSPRITSLNIPDFQLYVRWLAPNNSTVPIRVAPVSPHSSSSNIATFLNKICYLYIQHKYVFNPFHNVSQMAALLPLCDVICWPHRLQIPIRNCVEISAQTLSSNWALVTDTQVEKHISSSSICVFCLHMNRRSQVLSFSYSRDAPRSVTIPFGIKRANRRLFHRSSTD